MILSLSRGFESPRKGNEFYFPIFFSDMQSFSAEFSGGGGGGWGLFLQCSAVPEMDKNSKHPSTLWTACQIKSSQGWQASCPYQEKEGGKKIQSTLSGILKHSSFSYTPWGLFCIILLDEHRGLFADTCHNGYFVFWSCLTVFWSNRQSQNSVFSQC